MTNEVYDIYCRETVRKGGQDPHECGLERPCPTHEYREPRSIAHTAYHRTGVYLGELRDV